MSYCCWIAILLAIQGAAARDPRQLPSKPSELTRDASEWVVLAPGVEAHIVPASGNAVSNSGFVILDHGVVAFDAHFTREAGESLLARIRSVAAEPVRYLVCSHFHPDHTQGIQAFPASVQILASSATRRDVLQKNLPMLGRAVAALESQIESLRRNLGAAPDMATGDQMRRQLAQREEQLARLSAIRVSVPDLTTEDELDISDGRAVRIFSPGPGHTDGDLVMLVPDAKVLFAGDLFFNAALPNARDGSMLAWMKTLEEMLKIDADVIVPGHGQIGTKKELREFLRYFEDLKSLVEPPVSRGEHLEQVLQEVQLPMQYRGWEFGNFFQANVQKMYTELKAIQPPAPETEKPQGKPKP